MRARALFSLVGALIAAIALVSSSGAATTKAQRAARIDVSTRTAVIHYLRSIHVNPKGVVIQRGLRNYAGARCPGKHWVCTRTKHPVVQIARPGGSNVFRCATASCAVVQFARAAPAATNTAKCIKIVGLTQTCTINQSSTSQNNVAIVYQLAPGLLTTTQTASLKASITQQATSGSNTACVSQNALLDGSTVSTKPVAVNLNAHQSITITQDSSSGNNAAQSSATPTGACDTGHQLTQRQLLNSIVAGRGSVTQNENAAVGACGDGVANDNSNMCLDIEQNQGAAHGVATGTNNATYSQTNSLTAIANTPAGPVTQTQSSLDTTTSFNGGLVATVNQDTTGVSTANSNQSETQCEDAAKSGLISCKTGSGSSDFNGTYTLTQNQYGPEGVGKLSPSQSGPIHFSHVSKGLGSSTQTGGNPGDVFKINQASTQSNDQGSGSNQTNTVQADCTTSGNCTASQTTNVDGQTHTNTQSGQEVSTTTTCTGSTCQTPEIVFDGSTGTSAPPDTLGPYNMTAFGSDPQPLGDVSGVSDSAGTIGFSPDLDHLLVGAGWATWSNGYTGDVYAEGGDQAAIALPSGTQAFYFYAEPDAFSDFEITATAQDGTTSGPISVNGEGGAEYYGFYGLGGATLSSITVANTDTSGFAIGEFGISPAAPPSP